MKKMILTALTLLATNTACAAGWSEPLTINSLWTEGASDMIGFETAGGQAYTTSCLPNYWLFTATTEQRRLGIIL